MASPEVAPPISKEQLSGVINKVCSGVFESAQSYDHDKACGSWNNQILEGILKEIESLMEAKDKSDASAKPDSADGHDSKLAKPKLRYKFLIHSSIVQHTAPISQLDPETKQLIKDEDLDSDQANSSEQHKVTLKHEHKGKRGLHVATCAIWNAATDGVYNTKYEPGPDKDWDVIISISWLSC